MRILIVFVHFFEKRLHSLVKVMYACLLQYKFGKQPEREGERETGGGEGERGWNGRVRGRARGWKEGRERVEERKREIFGLTS